MTDRVRVPPAAVDRLRSLLVSAERANIAVEHYSAGLLAVLAPGRRLLGLDDSSGELLLLPLEDAPSAEEGT